MRRNRRRVPGGPGQFHRARAVPLVGFAVDAARGHCRRLGPFLRSGAWFGGGRAAAGMASLPAGLVPGDLRLRGDRPDVLSAGRIAFAGRPLQIGRRHAMTPFLEVKDMRKSYGAINAVDGVTLSVGPGEIVGVIGPNGSGKTTLFNSILGQIKPTGGAVEFCGEDITGMSPLELSRRGVGPGKQASRHGALEFLRGRDQVV